MVRGELLMVLLLLRTPVIVSLLQREGVLGIRPVSMLIVSALRLRFASLTTPLYILLCNGYNFKYFFW